MATEVRGRLRLLIAKLLVALFGAPGSVDMGDGKKVYVLPGVAGGDGSEDDDSSDDDSDDDSEDDDSDSEDDNDSEDDDSDDEDDDEDDEEDSEEDSDKDTVQRWKKSSRKHEKAAKKHKKRADKAEAKLAKLESENKSDRDKAVEKAKEEGRKEAAGEAKEERQQFRLETAVTKSANKGVEIERDGKTVRVKFADSDDALVHLERAIAKGDVDKDDLFGDDDKVDREELEGALKELLEDKPHLAEEVGKKGKPKGDADGGKGKSGGGTKSLEDESPEDALKRIQRK